MYIPIQDIRKDTLVKTLNNGFVPAKICGSIMFNNKISHDERIVQRLYKCSNQNYPTLFEDLIMTGAHSILEPRLNRKQLELMNYINNTNRVTPYKVDGMCKLLSCVDTRNEIYTSEEKIEVFTIVLENAYIYKNYGIYANGLLVESTPEYDFKLFSNMNVLHDNNADTLSS